MQPADRPALSVGFGTNGASTLSHEASPTSASDADASAEAADPHSQARHHPPADTDGDAATGPSRRCPRAGPRRRRDASADRIAPRPTSRTSAGDWGAPHDRLKTVCEPRGISRYETVGDVLLSVCTLAASQSSATPDVGEILVPLRVIGHGGYAPAAHPSRRSAPCPPGSPRCAGPRSISPSVRSVRTSRL